MFLVEGFEDPSGRSPAELVSLFAQVERARRLVEAAATAIVAEVDQSGAYRADGHASVSGWVRALGRWSNADALQHRQVADLAAADDGFRTALASGAIGWSQAVELGRVFANPRCGTDLLADLGSFVDKADHVPHRELRARLDVWTSTHDVAGAHDTADRHHERRTATIRIHDGVVRGSFTGSGAAGAAMLEVFERFRQAEFDTDWATATASHGMNVTPATLPRTDPQRRFDALLAVFTAAATPREGRAPEPLVNVVVDIHTLHEILEQPSFDQSVDVWHRRCGTTDGTTLAPGEVLAAMWAGHVRAVIVDHDVIIGMGRRRRLFTGRARDAVLLRTERCVWPGCDEPAGRCQADHQTDYQHGGGTDPANGAPLCGRHNRFKSAHGYQVCHHTRHDTWHTHRPDHTEVR